MITCPKRKNYKLSGISFIKSTKLFSQQRRMNTICCFHSFTEKNRCGTLLTFCGVRAEEHFAAMLPLGAHSQIKAAVEPVVTSDSERSTSKV